jgi:hypothetical protein
MLTPDGQAPVAAATPGRALVGVIHPPTQVVLARPVARPADPARLVTALRQIWQHTFARDTFKMAAKLIATDWRYLQPGIRTADRPAATGGDVVEGVGVAAGDSVAQPENFCLADVGDLGTDWLCLIDPVGDTVTVHTGDGQFYEIYPLAG